MNKDIFINLDDRGLIAIHGDDARSFLQGIVSCDVELVSPDTVIYGAFLTPQGKYLFDFFMGEMNGSLILDTSRHRIPDFIKRLSLYKLRADVKLEDVSEQYQVLALPGNPAPLGLSDVAGNATELGKGLIYTDPRLAAAGARAILPVGDGLPAPFSEGSNDAYDQHRIALGLPDSAQDLIVDKSTLLENGFDELSGVSWTKGCYMGQEVTARMKHRGLIKKRLVCVDIDGPAPEPGTILMSNDREAGEMRSSSGPHGLAMIKLDFMDQQLHSGQTTLSVRKPVWATF
jgi:hypothetical protein